MEDTKYALIKSKYYALVEVLQRNEVALILDSKIKELENENVQLKSEIILLEHELSQTKDKNKRDYLSELNITELQISIIEKKKVIEQNEKAISAFKRALFGNDFWIRLEEPDEKPWNPNIRYQFVSPDNTTILSFTDKSGRKKHPLAIKKVLFVLEDENLLKIQVNDRQEFEKHVDEVRKKSLTLKLFLKPNTIVIERQIRALENLIYRPQRNHQNLIKLIEPPHISDWEPLNKLTRVKKYFVLTKVEYPGTIEQREFVRKALTTPDYVILEGPPGSGKTTAILELILQLANRGKRILLVASTHVAVDNVLEKLDRLKSEYPEISEYNNVFPMRIGKVIEKISAKIKKYTVDTTEERVIEDLYTFLSKKPRNKLLESQKELLTLLKTRRSNNGELNNNTQQTDDTLTVIKDLISESVNLFCGTTLGFMAHIDIVEILTRTSSGPIFDVMILDEASKTPFSEFLVPARLAKKWIIIGDRNQLSPYLEDEHVATYIRNRMNYYYKKHEKTLKESKFKFDNFLRSTINISEVLLNKKRFNTSLGIVIDDSTSYLELLLTTIHAVLN